MSAAVSAGAVQNSYALSFEPADEVTVHWDTTVGYSAGWRVSEQNQEALANPIDDDGNRNFKKGAMVNNRFSVLSEADIQYKNYGAFIRGSAFYDGAYYGKTDNDSPLTYNGYGNHDGFSKQVRDAHGSDARILDAFVYGSFDIKGQLLNVRVGEQVVSWGESLFIPGISSAMSPADATKTTVPGVEVKDILLPVGQVFAQYDVNDSLSIAAYSQWEWAKNEISESGSYFGASDILDKAGQTLPLGGPYVATHNPDIDAKSTGQWGVAVNYYAENLGYGTDFGLYYINYHDKNPSIVLDFNNPGPNPPAYLPSGYHSEFVEDIKLIGISFSTLIGDTNVGGEIAYRKDAAVNPAGYNNSSAAIRIADTVQAQLSVIHSFGASAIADDVVFSGEFGYNEVRGINNNNELPGYADLTMDESGAGIAGSVTLKYNSVFPGTNLEVPVNFSHNINGNSAAGGFTKGQNSDRVSVGTKFIYKTQWEAGINYSAYFGSYEENQYTDRDFVSVNLKYSF
ncbi:DUF1302 domain-containing protein [Endozoicomonas atrinae]|uniref:DUF1302 domain-containing protein n=1 Tax=Endozoicomonas atrinae TaxID=1333660 RepID=UPI00082633BE|nr:DUF1302 domain-containing protein [Endozoicomonas atrinae]